MLDVKKARNLIDEQLFKAMSDYNPQGPKKDLYKAYQKLKWINTNLYTYSAEQIEEHSVVLCKIWKWVQAAVTLRRANVEKRRSIQLRMKKDREDAIKADQERTEKMNTALEEAQAVSERYYQSNKFEFRCTKKRLTKSTRNLTRWKWKTRRKKRVLSPSQSKNGIDHRLTSRSLWSSSTKNIHQSRFQPQSLTISMLTTTLTSNKSVKKKKTELKDDRKERNLKKLLKTSS